MDKVGCTDVKVASDRGEIVPKDFAAAVKDIKLAILQSRARAAHASNVEALKLYFYVGGYVSKKTRTAKWGSGAIDALSNRLQVELPGLRGFSASGIKRMRLLFEAWKEAFEIRPLPMDESSSDGIISIRPLPMVELATDVDAVHDQDVDERVLSKSLVANIEKTIQALGGDDFCAARHRHLQDAQVHSQALPFPRSGHRRCPPRTRQRA